jgi:hypothetical protein
VVKIGRKSLIFQLYLEITFLFVSANVLILYFFSENGVYYFLTLGIYILISLLGILFYFFYKSKDYYYFPKTLYTFLNAQLYSFIGVYVVSIFFKILPYDLIITIITGSILIFLSLFGIILVSYMYRIRDKYKY